MARLAINPNTVLKAYRELEHDGLVAARPGVGTFVTRTLTDASLAAHGRCAGTAALAGRAAGPGSTTRASRPCSDHLSRHSTRRTIADRRPGAPGLTKRTAAQGAARLHLDIPAGRVVGLVGPNGAGKTTLLNLAVGLLAPTAGTIEVLGGRPGQRRRRSWPRSASSPRTRPPTPG